jgi:hypothetical protein
MIEQRGSKKTVKRTRLDLESKLLLLAMATCIWAIAQLAWDRPIPVPLSVVAVVGLVALLANWCEESGRHAVARFAVLSVCYGVMFAACVIGIRYFFLEVLGAFLFLYNAWSAFAMLRKTGRGQNTVSVVSTAPPVIKTKSDVSSQLTLPMMPVRDMVLIPGMVTPLVVGRDFSVRALEYAKANNGEIFLATQHDGPIHDPGLERCSGSRALCELRRPAKPEPLRICLQQP